MNRLREDEELRKRLQKEMNQFTMSEQQKRDVLKRAQSHKASFWNREISIPLPIAAAVMLVLLAVPAMGWLKAHSLQPEPLIAVEPTEQNEERLIVTPAGVYYASELEGGNR